MPQKPGRPAPADNRDSTRLESDDEIRQVLEARRARLAKPAPAQTAIPVAEAVVLEVEAQPERPAQRPPMAMLCLVDDGKLDGEWIRLRADRTVIGRTDGDIRIPHDSLISGRHAEIVRQRSSRGYRWMLVDLQSTNGTFVRIGSTALRHDNELLIGAGRYRFETSPADSMPADSAGPPQSTQAWSGASVSTLVPSLVEITPTGPGQRYSLVLPEYWIGRDAQSCAIARPNDALVNARHARLHRDATGQWHIDNNKSLNGLWLRLAEPMHLGGGCQFRAGEQKFLFRGK
ncbi:MAG TPA: FHA domain-containing protein [Gemmataceae bacterium]|nr:FHA domain-containing protein [Gemmataceae bacterium]